MSEELKALLRAQAVEIAEEGYLGWGNSMVCAADEIERLSAGWLLANKTVLERDLELAALKDAAKAVLDGLNERIDYAVEQRHATPVFEGIAALHSALYAAPAVSAEQQGVPQCVLDWFEAKQAHTNAVAAYNDRLMFVREHMPFGTSVDPEYQIMEAADRKVRSLCGPMFVGLSEVLAAAPAPSTTEGQGDE